jgi:hypothetical protein
LARLPWARLPHNPLSVLRVSLSVLLCAFAALALGADGPPPSDAVAQPEAHKSRWLLQTSIYTDHFSTEERHTNNQRLIGLEWWAADNWILGAASFRNSFDQPSQYLYIGKLWRPLDNYQLVHLKLTWGILHGYKGQYKDKVPFNSDNGIAPLLLPSIGLSGKRFTTDVVFFGTAGALVTIGVLVP